MRELVLLGVKTMIRRPLSNWLSKATFIAGGLIVSTPLFEHLVFSALLKHTLDIDLGISVPDIPAYIAGGLIILSALTHNLLFVMLNQQYALQQQSQQTEGLRMLWGHVDTTSDDTVRLTNLYCTPAKQSDVKYVDKADESILLMMEYARKHRPFLISDDIYEEVMALSALCRRETAAFRACVQMKKKKNADYDFLLARKTAMEQADELTRKYTNILTMIRNEVDVPASPHH